jgi:hypothetical protein
MVQPDVLGGAFRGGEDAQVPVRAVDGLVVGAVREIEGICRSFSPWQAVSIMSSTSAVAARRRTTS